MPRLLVSLLMVIALSACASAPAPAPASPSTASGAATTPVASAPPAATVATPPMTPTVPAVDCLSGLPQVTSDEALPVVLAAVAGSGWTPTHVWFSSGALCPMQDCLFDPGAMFPPVAPPSGGESIGSVEIAFAEIRQHAGLNLASVAAKVVATLIGYRERLLTWCSGECPTAVVTEGRFRMELVLPHLDWRTQDPINGSALFLLQGDQPATVYGSGGGIIAFSFHEVGGAGRKVDWLMTDDCGPRPLDPATPLNVPLFKSGPASGSGAEGDFLEAFFADPLIHLPAGTWDVIAVAVFAEAPDCSGTRHTMTTTQRISVSG